jgi:hypothetical protein
MLSASQLAEIRADSVSQGRLHNWSPKLIFVVEQHGTEQRQQNVLGTYQ